ncbi:MAG: preprotein translocase subunit YajC, partial [Gaiellaceae bacterium]
MRPGGEVVTAGGIIGTVRSIVDREELRVEIAPDVLVRQARKALAGVLSPGVLDGEAIEVVGRHPRRAGCDRPLAGDHAAAAAAHVDRPPDRPGLAGAGGRSSVL